MICIYLIKFIRNRNISTNKQGQRVIAYMSLLNVKYARKEKDQDAIIKMTEMEDVKRIFLPN